MWVIRWAHPGQMKPPGPVVKQGEVKWGRETLQLPLQREQGPEREAGKGPSLTLQGAWAYSTAWLGRRNPQRGQKGPKAGYVPRVSSPQDFQPPCPLGLSTTREDAGGPFHAFPRTPGGRDASAQLRFLPRHGSQPNTRPLPQ